MSPAGDDPPFRWSRRGRSPATALAVAGIWAGLIAGILLLDMAWWIAGIVGLFTLPALHDLATNPASGLTLGDESLAWFSGRRSARVALLEIDHIRFDTRLDFSVRATVVLTTGRKVRLPFESTPPHRMFEAACAAHGLRTARHHFSPIG